ncbi:uncharacterized protein STEHIDRAFT_155573 [Stereum hirsutum FP-91666 SS1]|uniref:uncharacterized protein n=1 Tax=Stereum hirsutum (strain FP-91666) TaxID=721885 RepID=UPI000440C390|nr:uncharacterized protein STEHIDRAFT_155573 [Stereum hirsutum FP-91666 SS1]EIM88220.1 hypothetical protein STEHIDRAFT_155573 [Stereum hirsutum FP-91666 SS1]
MPDSQPALVLLFVSPLPETNPDPRTFTVFRPTDDGSGPIELYKFYHPNSGLTFGSTTFHRKNMATAKWETAGEIDWTSATNATAHFGIEEVPMRELRKPKKADSKSRRFKASGSEYKWKKADNNKDLFCVDSRGKTVASWNQTALTLRVEKRVEPILDRIVVTCLLNTWMNRQGQW